MHDLSSQPGRRLVRGAQDAPTLLDELEAARWRGPRYEMFCEDLYLYGFDVLRGQVRTGKILTVETNVPRPRLSQPEWALLHDSAEQREALVLEALMVAVPKFVQHLRTGSFDPHGPASLTSYFFRGCVFAFWKAAERWSQQRHREITTLARLYGEPATSAYPDSSRATECREALHRVIDDASPEARIICAGILAGRTHAEIGTDLGISDAAVAARLYQLRKKAWALVRRGMIDAALVPGTRASRRPALTSR